MGINTKIDCTHFVSANFANVPLLQKWPVLGAVSHCPLINQVLLNAPYNPCTVASSSPFQAIRYFSTNLGQTRRCIAACG